MEQREIAKVVEEVGKQVVQKGAGTNLLEAVTTYPKASATIGVVSIAALCTLGYFAYRRMEDTEIEINGVGSSKPTRSSMEAGNLKGETRAAATQHSARDTNMKVGDVEATKGEATLNQRMGYGK